MTIPFEGSERYEVPEDVVFVMEVWIDELVKIQTSEAWYNGTVSQDQIERVVELQALLDDPEEWLSEWRAKRFERLVEAERREAANRRALADQFRVVEWHDSAQQRNVQRTQMLIHQAGAGDDSTDLSTWMAYV